MGRSRSRGALCCRTVASVGTKERDRRMSHCLQLPAPHAESSGQLPLPLASIRQQPKSVAPRGIRHRIAGLFAGIGGVERGLGRAGHQTVLLCENDGAAMAVLQSRFPELPLHGDVRTLHRLPEETTLVVAGFPCQDLSQAGMTKGLAGARSGLVGEVFRLIEAHRTPWVLLECSVHAAARTRRSNERDRLTTRSSGLSLGVSRGRFQSVRATSTSQARVSARNPGGRSAARLVRR